MSEFLRIDTTTESEAEAQSIATELIRERLAACVQTTGPIQSTYIWDGQVETSREWRLSIKTTTDRYEAVEQAIVRLHSYDVPQIVAFPIDRGSESYLHWIRDSLS